MTSKIELMEQLIDLKIYELNPHLTDDELVDAYGEYPKRNEAIADIVADFLEMVET